MTEKDNVIELLFRVCAVCGAPGGSEEDPMPTGWFQINVIEHWGPARFRPLHACFCDDCGARLGGGETILKRALERLL